MAALSGSWSTSDSFSEPSDELDEAVDFASFLIYAYGCITCLEISTAFRQRNTAWTPASY
jgi:hypothetical protein